MIFLGLQVIIPYSLPDCSFTVIYLALREITCLRSRFPRNHFRRKMFGIGSINGSFE
jgi:hypothetical protein